MRKSYGIELLFGGLLLLGCGDDPSGPEVGPDTSWQFACPNGSASECKGSSGAHRQTDEVNIDVVKCNTDSAGLQITLEDPGADAKDGEPARSRSILQIANASVDKELCVVTLTEYAAGGTSKKVLIDKCTANKQTEGSPAGSCVLEGEKGDGYGFNGSLHCTGMSLNGKGKPDFALGEAGSAGNEPAKLQIRSCK